MSYELLGKESRFLQDTRNSGLDLRIKSLEDRIAKVEEELREEDETDE